MKHPGFLVFQAGIFLCLLLMILSIAVPRFIFLQRRAPYYEAQKFRQFCWYARQHALATGKDCVVTIDVKNGTYSGLGRSEKLLSGVIFDTVSGALGPPSNPTRPLLKPVTFKNETITLYAEGIVESGTVYITDSDRTVLYAVSSGVGHTSLLRLYKYQGSWELVE